MIKPSFGYFPNPSKSYLAVNESFISFAKSLFDDIGIKVVTSERVLGGVIGERSGRDLFVVGKLQKWLCNVQQLSSIATTQPQAPLVAYTKSLQCEWNYL